MKGENPLDAYALGYLAHSESLAGTTAAPTDDSALKYLDAFLVALLDPDVDLDSISGAEPRYIFFHLALFYLCYTVLSLVLSICSYLLFFNVSNRSVSSLLKSAFSSRSGLLAWHLTMASLRL